MKLSVWSSHYIGLSPEDTMRNSGERYAPQEILGYKLDYIKKMFDYLDKITEQ